MRVTFNGAPAETEAATLADLLAEPLGQLPEGHAVAVNGEVVPRSAHASRPLAEHDAVEVVTAVAGG